MPSSPPNSSDSQNKAGSTSAVLWFCLILMLVALVSIVYLGADRVALMRRAKLSDLQRDKLLKAQDKLQLESDQSRGRVQREKRLIAAHKVRQARLQKDLTQSREWFRMLLNPRLRVLSMVSVNRRFVARLFWDPVTAKGRIISSNVPLNRRRKGAGFQVWASISEKRHRYIGQLLRIDRRWQLDFDRRELGGYPAQLAIFSGTSLRSGHEQAELPKEGLLFKTAIGPPPKPTRRPTPPTKKIVPRPGKRVPGRLRFVR